MKTKGYSEDESDNEFEVDEPEELQENSDDDWAPTKKGTKRPPAGKKSTPKKKLKKTTSSEEEDEDEELPKKKRGAPAKAKTPAKPRGPKSARNKAKEEEEEEDEEEDEEDEEEDEDIDDEELDEEEDEEESAGGELNQKAPKEFSSGAFVVLKSDFNASGDPPIWKIDGKALLQKYIPFTQDGKLLYKNTSVYSGWTINNKEQYYPATVVFKQQTRKEHIVEFQRDLIQKEETSE